MGGATLAGVSPLRSGSFSYPGAMPEQHGTPWTAIEIDAVVESYFRMLRAHVTGDPYVKLRENELVQRRTGRTHGSVERKFQNVSAALLDLGAGDFVRGYVPLRNSQQALRDAVSERWRDEPGIEALMRAAAADRVPDSRVDLVWSAPPKFTVEPQLLDRRRSPVRTDFLKLDADNRDLGLAGERVVVELERHSLRQRGLDQLARQVEHVSRTQGDGLGFDVLSFTPDGGEKFIEVKTTRKQKEFPFLVSRNEVEFSAEEKDRFHLYRVFDFGRPRAGLFAVAGSLNETCFLTPSVYAARTA
jgi:hypothetical protein